MAIKLCPLRKGKNDDEEETELFLVCEEERCAWWLHDTFGDKQMKSGRCAILEIAQNSKFK
jgi:hypothetical protein